MTTELIDSLRRTQDTLGPEHSAAVIRARIEMRGMYLTSRERVIGVAELDGTALHQMDALDAMVALWLVQWERTEHREAEKKQAAEGAVSGERLPP